MVVEPHCVLGVSIGTQKIGLAVIKENRLLVKKVSTFNSKWNNKKLSNIIRAIDRTRWRNGVTAVSIKVPPSSHYTAGLKALIREIKRYYTDKNIPFHVCTIKELKSHGINEQRRNKRQLVHDMAEQYPDLRPKAEKELNSRIAYYTKMFEAIAAAELLQSTIK